MNFDTGSFRDRTARVFYSGDQVYRTLTHDAWDAWQNVAQTTFFQRRMQARQIVETRELNAAETRQFAVPPNVSAVLQHARIPFISYPYEWPFGMLQRAALLHLEILSDAVAEGQMLKDATPYNIQFCGSQPAFIDIGSFVPLVPGEPWLAYRQFCELMLFPLLLQAYRGVDFQPLLRAQQEGIAASQFMEWMRWRDLLRAGVLSHGWLQALLERQTQARASSTINDLRNSGFDARMILHNVNRLTRLVGNLRWVSKRTQWTKYDQTLPHVADDLQAKSEFVAGVCQQQKRRLVWDLGCNDGRFSRIAAEFAETVIAMDQDHACIEKLFASLEATQTTILPLRIELSNPSPAQGWRGVERKRLEDRGSPELVLCLGLIHHLVIAANIPLPDVIDWLASLNAELVLEFPSKQDPMVQALLRNKHDQYDDYSGERLEQELQQRFHILRRVSLPSGERTLFHAVPHRQSD